MKIRRRGMGLPRALQGSVSIEIRGWRAWTSILENQVIAPAFRRNEVSHPRSHLATAFGHLKTCAHQRLGLFRDASAIAARTVLNEKHEIGIDFANEKVAHARLLRSCSEQLTPP